MSAKIIKVTMWVCITVLAVQFLGAGIGKLLGTWSSKFADWGYSMIFMYTIGFFEVIGVLGLFHFKTRKSSNILFILVMIGAAYTHISTMEYSRVLHNGIIVGFSLFVLYLNKKSKI